MIALIEPWHIAAGIIAIIVGLLVWLMLRKPSKSEDLPFPVWRRYDEESRRAEYAERQKRASGNTEPDDFLNR